MRKLLLGLAVAASVAFSMPAMASPPAVGAQHAVIDSFDSNTTGAVQEPGLQASGAVTAATPGKFAGIEQTPIPAGYGSPASAAPPDSSATGTVIVAKKSSKSKRAGVAPSRSSA